MDHGMGGYPASPRGGSWEPSPATPLETATCCPPRFNGAAIKASYRSGRIANDLDFFRHVSPVHDLGCARQPIRYIHILFAKPACLV